MVELLSHQLLHGLPQLSETDLAVAIRVKLGKPNESKFKVRQKLQPNLCENGSNVVFFLYDFRGALVRVSADLFEGIPQLLHTDHVGSLSQHLGTHQLDKVLKVHPAATWRRKKPLTLNVERTGRLPELQKTQTQTEPV